MPFDSNMYDAIDRPFVASAAGPSSGQNFRRFGQQGRARRPTNRPPDDAEGQFEDVAEDLDAMSARFVVLGRDVAESSLEIMRKHILKYITGGQGNFHGYSMGRLAATIGRYDPSQFVMSVAGSDAEEQAAEWAESNAPDYQVDTYEEMTISEMGAYSSVRRARGNEWMAEVGTFTPYAGLVEDGGTMPIHPFKNSDYTITARWEANHMFKRGAFDSAKELGLMIQGKVGDILNQ